MTHETLTAEMEGLMLAFAGERYFASMSQALVDDPLLAQRIADTIAADPLATSAWTAEQVSQYFTHNYAHYNSA